MKRNHTKTFKSSSWKKLFVHGLCYWCKLLRWLFLSLCDSWNRLFFIWVYRYSEVFSTVTLKRSEKRKSRYIPLTVFSRSVKKLLSIDCVKIYLFSIFFFKRFSPVEKSFLNWFCQYLFSLDIFLIDFTRWKISWFINFKYSVLLKQLFRAVLIRRCSENIQQIYRTTPVPNCDFNKVTKQLY